MSIDFSSDYVPWRKRVGAFIHNLFFWRDSRGNKYPPLTWRFWVIVFFVLAFITVNAILWTKILPLQFEKGKTDGFNSGYQAGYAAGRTTFYNEGHSAGWSAGYQKGKSDGYQAGRSDGYQSGKNDGAIEGRAEGYRTGKSDGTIVGRADGWTEGYQKGKTEGEEQGRQDILSKLETLRIGTGTKGTLLLDLFGSPISIEEDNQRHLFWKYEGVIFKMAHTYPNDIPSVVSFEGDLNTLRKRQLNKANSPAQAQ